MAENQHSKTVPVSTPAKDSRPPAGRKARTKKPGPYTLGNIAGEDAAHLFYERLMERHPNQHGVRLARLILEGVQIPLDLDDEEATKRRGWLVGLCFALECRLYEGTKSGWLARRSPRTPLDELFRLASEQAASRI